MSENREYKKLYDQLLSFVQELHSGNKKRIRGGLWCMLALPVVLLLARRLTDSNRVAFLLIWIFCMFVLAGYLIWIAYIDDSIQKKLRDAVETEKQFDDLLSLEPPRRLLEAYEKLDAKFGSHIERVDFDQFGGAAEEAPKAAPLPQVSEEKTVTQVEAAPVPAPAAPIQAPAAVKPAPAAPAAAPATAAPVVKSGADLLAEVEDYIPRSGCQSYFALCSYAHAAHPEWMEIIRANAQHLDLFIRAFAEAEGKEGTK